MSCEVDRYRTTKAVLSAVFFHRLLGGFQPTSFEVCGVTFSAPAAPESDAVIAAKTELICRALLDDQREPPFSQPRSKKLFVSFYPTPLPALPPATGPARPPRQRTWSYNPNLPRAPSPAAAGPTPSSVEGPSNLGPTTAPPPPRSSRRASAAALAHAAPSAVTSALGWFSASARAAWVGTQDDSSIAAGSARRAAGTCAEGGGVEGQEEEVRMLEVLRGQGKTPFEGWVIDLEVLSEPRAPSVRTPGEEDERLRAQLHDFLLRALEFTLIRTSHIPPITTTDLMPYGCLILVDPPKAPFDVPRRVEAEVTSFPALHRTLVATPRSDRAIQRAVSVGGRR
ncbi:hypothetical protein JCM8202v2_002187 [Rhodotorula sphaerocarpa]